MKNKVDQTILIANAIDHFNTSLYGFIAPILAPIFFPNHDPIVQLILAYGILATSLITRPVGTFAFGMLAKYKGPFVTMSYALIGLALASIGMGCVPDHASVGWVATFMLILLKALHGIFAAGENTIAKLYILENKPYKQAFKASYYYQTSTMVGIISASLLATTIGHAWRTCFMLSGMVCFLGYFLRYLQRDTHRENGLHYENVLKSFWIYRRDLFRVAITTGISHITYAIPFIVMNSFVPMVTDITFETMMMLNTTLLVFDTFCIGFMGSFLRHYSTRYIMIVSSSVLGISLPLLFYFLPNSSLLYVSFVRIWIVVWGVVFACPMNLYYKQIFPQHAHHYLLIGMGSAFGGAFFGRLTPSFCLWLWYTTHQSIAIGIYVLFIALCVVYSMLKREDLEVGGRIETF